jgi:hypothetical protein
LADLDLPAFFFAPVRCCTEWTGGLPFALRSANALTQRLHEIHNVRGFALFCNFDLFTVLLLVE